ncbi:MAG: DHH family phosphoesterase [Patescibacteria group bacterium]|nr:DHH family phosphoesterase [Patescibacteria group bacterium]
MKVNYTEAIKEIEKAKKIGIMTHVRGDGDAFGSLLGLKNILEELDKKVIIFSNEKPGKHLEFIMEMVTYEPASQYEPIDLLIVTDVSTLSRLTCPEVFREAKKNGTRVMDIDHHAEGDIYGSIDVLIKDENISSAAELVFWLSEALSMRLDRTTAELLLIGIETDTNFLQNSNTVNKTTFKAKAELLKSGARIESLVRKLSQSTTIDDLKFRGIVLGRAKLNHKYQTLTTYITREDHKEYGLEVGISSAIASLLDQTRDAGVVVVIEERDEKTLKVSLRSNNSNVNVAELASFFGGGGHVKAAGFEIEAKVAELIN